jgi:hypothetical protein
VFSFLPFYRSNRVNFFLPAVGGQEQSSKSDDIRRNLLMDNYIPFFDSLKENFSFFFIKNLAWEYPCPFDLTSKNHQR